MRKIASMVFYFIIFILVVGLLSGCGAEKELSKEDNYISLALEADSYQKVYDLIQEYSSEAEEQEDFKARLAFVEGNDVIQEALLSADELTPELMISIFKHHKWTNIHLTSLRNFLIKRISEMQLNTEQELEIAEIGVEVYQEGLLAKKDVSCDTLCYLLNEQITKLALNYYRNRELIVLQASRYWTLEEKERLLDTGNELVREVFRLKGGVR